MAGLSGVSGLRCLLRAGDPRSPVAGFTGTPRVGDLFNYGLGGGTWPGTLNLIMVSDNSEHAIRGITSSARSSVEVLMSYMLD